MKWHLVMHTEGFHPCFKNAFRCHRRFLCLKLPHTTLLSKSVKQHLLYFQGFCPPCKNKIYRTRLGSQQEFPLNNWWVSTLKLPLTLSSHTDEGCPARASTKSRNKRLKNSLLAVKASLCNLVLCEIPPPRRKCKNSERLKMFTGSGYPSVKGPPANGQNLNPFPSRKRAMTSVQDRDLTVSWFSTSSKLMNSTGDKQPGYWGHFVSALTRERLDQQRKKTDSSKHANIISSSRLSKKPPKRKQNLSDGLLNQKFSFL